MIKVILACMAGMSTNVMRGKIEETAKLNNVEMVVKAIGMDDLDRYVCECNIILLGPQVKYNEGNVRKLIAKKNPSIPLMVIDSTDFGMMRGDIVYKKMMQLLDK